MTNPAGILVIPQCKRNMGWIDCPEAPHRATRWSVQRDGKLISHWPTRAAAAIAAQLIRARLASTKAPPTQSGTRYGEPRGTGKIIARSLYEHERKEP